MKKLLLSLVFSVSFNVFAADDLILKCFSRESKANGLSIARLTLQISQTKNQASMSMTRILNAGKKISTIKSNLYFTVDGSTYQLSSPAISKSGSKFMISALKTSPDSWTVTVFQLYLDTFSELVCPLPLSDIGSRG